MTKQTKPLHFSFISAFSFVSSSLILPQCAKEYILCLSNHAVNINSKHIGRTAMSRLSHKSWLVVSLLALNCVITFAQTPSQDSTKPTPDRQPASGEKKSAVIPPNLEARIIQLEDQRYLNGDELTDLLKHQTPGVRRRAALAIGRIGERRGTNPLIKALQSEKDVSAREMAAFALGEIEDVDAANALLEAANSPQESPGVRARAVEALGKIASVQANTEKLGQPTLDSINQSLVKHLPVAGDPLSADQKLLSLLTIAALMRVRNPAAVETLTLQLKSNDAEIRAQAANALARLRQPIG